MNLPYRFRYEEQCSFISGETPDTPKYYLCRTFDGNEFASGCIGLIAPVWNVRKSRSMER